MADRLRQFWLRPKAALCLLFLTPLALRGAQDFVARLGAGEFIITERDIADYQATQRCYPEGLDSRKAALMRQLEPAITAHILAKNAGIRITREALVQEEKRVDRETQAPEILACIKARFASRKDRYRHIFLRPIVLHKEFQRYWTQDRAVQRSAYGLSEAVARAVATEPFKAVADRYQLEYSTADYSTAEPEKKPGEAESAHARWSSFEPFFIEQYLKDLTPGGLRPEPVDGDADILWLRLLEKGGGRYRFERIRIKKLTVNEFLDSQPKIPFQIKDEELKAWLKGIRGNPYLEVLEF